MMMKHVHVHIHRSGAAVLAGGVRVNGQRGRTSDAEEKGKWVTINGAHVFVGEGGKIMKGPKALVGKSEGEAAGHKHNAEGTRENRYRELAAKARKDGNASEEARWLKAAEKEGTREGGKGDLVESEKQKAKNEHADKNKRPAPTKEGAKEKNYYSVVAAAWNSIPHPRDDRKITASQAAELDLANQEDMLTGYQTRARHYETKHTPEQIAQAMDVLRERKADREQQTKAPVAPEKKMPKADAFKAGKLEHDRASKGLGSYEKAAEHFEQAGEKGRAEQSRALSKRYGHDKGNAPGQTQVPKSRHAEKGGAPEGAEREGGPLKAGEKGVHLHKDFAEGDDQEYEVVGHEEKGRVDISPVKHEGGALRPKETVEGYMVHRRK